MGILVVALAVTLFTSPLTRGLFQKKPSVAPPSPRAPAQAPAPAAGKEAPELSQEELAAWRRRFAQAWSRDPFFTAEEEQALRAPKVATATASQHPAAPLPAYTVKMVLISGTSKLAAIDGRLVSEGEMLGDERVVEIHPDGVVLERAGQRRRVEVAGGAVPLIEVGPGPVTEKRYRR